MADKNITVSKAACENQQFTDRCHQACLTVTVSVSLQMKAIVSEDWQ